MNVPGSLRYVAYIVDGGRFSFTVDRSHGLNNPGGSQRESDLIITACMYVERYSWDGLPCTCSVMGWDELFT